MMLPYRQDYSSRRPSKKDILPPRKFSQEAKNVVALILLCVSIIIKGVAYGNSHWTTYQNMEFNSKLEYFPIMSHFYHNVEGCDDEKCRLFFAKHSEYVKVVQKHQHLPPPKIDGTFSRGINSRCETLFLTIQGSKSKYEKCLISKEYEINEFRVVRFLLITSMVADGFAILLWIFVHIRSRRQSMNQLFLVLVSTIGFISTFVTALSLGLFTQAVDFFDQESVMHLGWPFYITGCTCILTIATCMMGLRLFYSDYKTRLSQSRRIQPGFRTPQFESSSKSPSGSYSIYQMEASSAVIEEPRCPEDQMKRLMAKEENQGDDKRMVGAAHSCENFFERSSNKNNNYFRTNNNSNNSDHGSGQRTNHSGRNGNVDRHYVNQRRIEAEFAFQGQPSNTSKAFNEAL